MKVERVNVYLVRAGRLHPVIVEIVCDEGIVGIGEAAIAYGVGGTAAAGMVKDLATPIIGGDPSRIEGVWSQKYDHSFWGEGGGGLFFSRISAIEQGLWGIKSKTPCVPVF